MLVAYRLAGLSAREAHNADLIAQTQSGACAAVSCEGIGGANVPADHRYASVVRKAFVLAPMPRDGALTLSDVRGPTLTIVCEPCGRRCSPAV
jgi:hypothetical protein